MLPKSAGQRFNAKANGCKGVWLPTLGSFERTVPAPISSATFCVVQLAAARSIWPASKRLVTAGLPSICAETVKGWLLVQCPAVFPGPARNAMRASTVTLVESVGGVKLGTLAVWSLNGCHG